MDGYIFSLVKWLWLSVDMARMPQIAKQKQ